MCQTSRVAELFECRTVRGAIDCNWAHTVSDSRLFAAIRCLSLGCSKTCSPSSFIQLHDPAFTFKLFSANWPHTDQRQSLTLLRASLTARFLLFELTIFVDSSLCEINFSFENWIRFHIRWEGFRYRSLRHCCVSLRGELSEGIERSAPADFNCTHLAEVFWLRTSERTTRAFRRRFGELSSVVRYSHRPSAFC